MHERDNIMDGMSMDIEKNEREKLKAVFPECFTEGKLDIDKLLNMCGEYITDDYEKYEFKWKGKSECLQLAQKRSTGTLRPCADESVNFDTTKNLYIEGDNLEVLKLLQTSFYSKVKMIYIDPPYNTGNDFVYNDDFADPIAKYKEVTSQATKSNSEAMGRFHTNWLNMLYPRLRLAATLLRDDGVMFISIDDNELYNLKKVCDEAFGEENFVGNVIIKSNPRGSQSDAELAGQHEYLLIYAKNLECADIIGLELSLEMTNEYKFEDKNGQYRLLGLRQRGGFWRRSERPNLFYSIFVNPIDGAVSLSKTKEYSFEVKPIQPSTGEDGTWRWSKEKFEKDKHYLLANKINRSGNEVWDIFQKDYISGEDGAKRTKAKSLWDDREVNYQNGTTEIKELLGSGVFNYSKPVYLIKQMLRMIGASDSDLILDFFSGSATTAHAVMQLNAEDGGNRQFIMVQLPELCDEKSEAYKAGYRNICEIGKERIRRAGQKIMEQTSQMTLDERKPLDIGFKVFKLDTSNYKTWDNSPVGDDMLMLENRINSMIERVKPDRTDFDMVYEIMLKQGIELYTSVEQLDIMGKKAYSVREDCLLLICLDSGITTEMVEQMADYAPGKIIFGQACFPDMTAMSNAKLALKSRRIELKFV